jgi:hypothetical protein
MDGLTLATVPAHPRQSSGRCHTANAVCIQCMMGAMGAGAGATGTRAWLAHRGFRWLTPRRLRAITLALLAAALLVASTLSGSTRPAAAGHSAPAHAASAASATP